LLSHGDLTVFNIAIVRHLEFLNFEFLTVNDDDDDDDDIKT